MKDELALINTVENLIENMGQYWLTVENLIEGSVNN